MSFQKEQIIELLEIYVSKKATDEQEQKLMEFFIEAEEDNELKKYMQDIWEQFHPAEHSNKVDWNAMFENIMEQEKVASLPIRRIYWGKIAAATAVVLLLSLGGIYHYNSMKVAQLVKSEKDVEINDHRTAPVQNKATLTLSDGSIIFLENAENGALAIQGNVKVEKSADGQIIYTGNDTQAKMNTISVPKGSVPLRLQLADGSNVWLNVESSMTYPTAFTGKSRNVQIDGEVYFEVAPNTDMPFKVSKGDVEVSVLGTHFNFNAYENGVTTDVTLLEGSVQVKKGSFSGLLKPGQQAVISSKTNEKIKVRNAELDKVMAWKNGIFNFDGAPLDEVMRQLERWYNIEVVYEKGIPDIEFVGKMSKNIHLDDLLEILKKTKVHFKLIGGRKLLVSDN
jgi:ferric-dicitrate binding protein FerR (iron transport regulator)